jgi:hypothetical protein
MVSAPLHHRICKTQGAEILQEYYFLESLQAHHLSLTFKGPMTTLVVTESNGEWPYVDLSIRDVTKQRIVLRWTVGYPKITQINSMLTIDKGFLKPPQTFLFQKSR